MMPWDLYFLVPFVESGLLTLFPSFFLLLYLPNELEVSYILTEGSEFSDMALMLEACLRILSNLPL